MKSLSVGAIIFLERPNKKEMEKMVKEEEIRKAENEKEEEGEEKMDMAQILRELD
jgi:hypothetical protein